MARRPPTFGAPRETQGAPLLPQAEFWPVMPPEQTPERVRDRMLEFGHTHK